MSLPYGLISKDEVNPAIVYNINKNSSHLTDKKLATTKERYGDMHDWSEEMLESCSQEDNIILSIRNFKDQFLNQYEKAVALIREHESLDELLIATQHTTGLKDFIPLAYRVRLVTEEMQEDDPCCLNKFGGIPHPVMGLDFEKWPKCPNCHHWMRFLGQTSTYNLRWTIHNLTCFKESNEYPKNVSGLGWRFNSSGMPYREDSELHLHFWCHCNDVFSPNADALTISKYLLDKNYKENLDRHIVAYKNFMRYYKINEPNKDFGGNTSLEKITDYQIGFDLEIPETGWGDLGRFDLDELFDFYNDSELGNWKKSTKYTMFGVPVSQQTPKRFAGGNPFFTERMMPFINWSDEDYDITRQMYASLRNCDGNGKIYGKMDNSNT